jgi:OOP family OmpA-OmpF porin
MRSLPIFLVTVALVLGGAFAAMAAPLANCAKKVESFDFVVDHSGSMLMSYPKLKKDKIDVAKSLIVSINDKIPALSFDGGLHTVAPSATIVRQGAWDRAALGKSVAKIRSNLEILGRMTPLGDGLKAQESVFAGMKRNAAVILFTDGENNRGSDPVAAVQNIYQAQRDLVFHIVSFADTKEGKATLDRIAALNKGTVYVEAHALAANEAALDKFVRDVFCAGDEVIVLRGVNFAFNSYALDNKAMGILKEATALIKGKSGKVVLHGWTDAIGSDEYNLKLSQRRADSVESYLTKQGVPASRLTAIGKGKSFKYDNKTAEGRYMNRRTEVLTD